MAPSRVFGFALATLGIASCTALVDTDGLSGGAANQSDGDVSFADGSEDSADGDGGIIDGATGDRFCSSQGDASSFCEDFDNGSLSPVWRPRIDDGGAVMLDDSSVSSPPRSLRTSMAPPPPDASCRSAYDSHALALTYTTSARLDYDLRIGDGEAGGYPVDFIALNRLTVSGPGDADSRCEYFFLMRPGGAQLVIGPSSGSPQYLTLNGTVAPDRWTHLAMEIGGPAGPSAVSVWLDDTLVLDHAAITVSCGYGRVTEVTPGLFCIASNTSNAVESRVDNLVISVK